MTREELLKAIIKLDRYNISDYYNDVYKHATGDYVQYEDLIDLINLLYDVKDFLNEQSK